MPDNLFDGAFYPTSVPPSIQNEGPEVHLSWMIDNWNGTYTVEEVAEKLKLMVYQLTTEEE